MAMLILGVGGYAVYLGSSTATATTNKRSLYLKMHTIKDAAITNLYRSSAFYPALTGYFYYQCLDRKGFPLEVNTPTGTETSSLTTLAMQINTTLRDCREAQGTPEGEAYCTTEGFNCPEGTQFILIILPRGPAENDGDLNRDRYTLKVLAINRRTTHVDLALKTTIFKNSDADFPQPGS